MKLMVGVIHHLISERKHELNAENVTTAQCVLLFEGGPFVVQFNTFGELKL